MAEFRITVVVDPTGAVRGNKAVQRSLKRTGDAANRTRGLIARAFGFVAAATAVRSLVRVTDAFQNMNNRLRTVTTGQGQLNKTMGALEGIARRTRTSLDGIVTLYQRGAIAAGQLGITNERLLNFVEKVGKALAVQGAAASTTRGALLQLSQALGSSIVRAEEFNSILEGAFPIALAAAQGMDRAGGSVARLRQLILAGEVTSKQFFVAFEKGSNNLDKLFAQTIPTIGQAFIVFKDSITLYIGRIDKAHKISETFARGLIRVSGDLDTVARVAAAAAIVLGVVLVNAAAKASVALVKLALSNPFTAIALAITTAIALLISFGDKIKVGGDGLANLRETAVAAFEVIGEEMEGVFNFLQKGANKALAFVESRFVDLGFTFEDVAKIAKDAVNFIIGHYVGLVRVWVVIFKKVREIMDDVLGSPWAKRTGKTVGLIIDVWASAWKLIGRVSLKVFDIIIKAKTDMDKKLGDINPDKSVVPKAIAFGKEVKDAYLSGLNEDFLGDFADTFGPGANALIDKINARAKEKALARIAAERKAQAAADAAKLNSAQVKPTAVPDPVVQKFLKDLERENELLRLNSTEREVRSQVLKLEGDLKRSLTAEEGAEVDVKLRLNQALAQESEALDAIRDPMIQYKNNTMAINALLAKNAINSREAAVAKRDLDIAYLDTETTISAGFERGFLKATKASEDFASTSEMVITNAFKGAEDALTEFFQTGKLNAASFFKQLAADFARLAAQQAIAAAAGAFSSGGGSGGLGGIIGNAVVQGLSSNSGGFHDGGAFTVGQGTAAARIPGIDNRLIAFKAKDGEKVTVTPKNENGAGGGVVNQIFNITSPDADSFNRSQTQLQNKANAGLSRARARR